MIDAVDLPTLGLTVLAVAVASIFRGFTGFGFAMGAVPLLSLIMPPSNAVPLVLWLSVLGGILDFRAIRNCHWQSIGWLQLGAVIGTPIGVWGLAMVVPSVARIVIAIIIIVAVIMLTRGFGFLKIPNFKVTLLIGLVSGTFSGLAAMPGPPVIAYYTASPVSRHQMRASLQIYFTMQAALTLLYELLIQQQIGRAGLLALSILPLAYAAQWLGRWCSKYGSDKVHKAIAMTSLIVIAFVAGLNGIVDLTW